MGKRTIVTGAQVVIDVPDPWQWSSREATAKEWLRDGGSIKQQVERHVDHYAHVGVELEQEEVCEFCGWGWTEGDSPHNGGCCSEDPFPED